jgi:4-hydroxybenzoate polyprenyltransferase
MVEALVGGDVRRNTLSVLFELSHGRRALLSVAQPVLGAILAAGGFPGARIVTLGLLAATAGMLCIYAANDLFDLEVDRRIVSEAALAEPATATGRLRSRRVSALVGSIGPRERPLARGLISRRVAVCWVGALGAAALALAYALRPGCALIFAACVGLEALYCAMKRRTWLKTVPAGALIGLGGLAGWYAVRDLDMGAVSFFALLAWWEVFGRNLSNDLADLSLDAPLGIRTLATTHGVRWSSRACFAGAVVILPLAALQPVPALLAALLAGAAAWAMTWPAFQLMQDPREAVAQWYFDRATLFPPVAVCAAVAFYAVQTT